MARYTIDFDDKFDKALNELTESTGAASKADVIRKAVASYKYLKDATQQAGQKISVTDQNDQVKKDIVLP